MSALSPSEDDVKHEIYQDIPTASSSRSPMTGTSAPSGVIWTQQGPMLRMENAVVETVVTHTTRTITSFPAIPLPRIPVPEAIAQPDHLAPELYPLATAPAPDDLQVFAITLGGKRVVIQEDQSLAPNVRLPTGTQFGPGWQRRICSDEPAQHADAERLDLVQAINRGNKGKERKRPLDSSRMPSHAEPSTSGSAMPVTMPTPPMVVETPVRPRRSPPRKKTRGLNELNLPHDASGVLLSPLPSPENESGPSNHASTSTARATLPTATTATPSIGSGAEVAALFSLPSLVSQFENLPDKLQQQVLTHLLRRSRMPTIQKISAFASTALKRDFISHLPHEIAVQILRKVDIGTLASALRVSKKWRKMIDSERTVWQQRLIDDGLWIGLGTEQDEEAVVTRRIETLEWQASQQRRFSKAETPTDDDTMSAFMPHLGVTETNQGLSEISKPVPLKHVYRKRYTSSRNWMKNTPTHTSFAGHGTNVVTCLQFDADKIISASDDHSINIYNTSNGQLRRRLDGHEGGVWALQYKGDTLVSGSTDRTVRIWDLDSLSEAHVFHGHSSTVRCLQIVEPVLDEATGEFYPAYPLLVTGSRDTTLRVWKLPRKGEQPLQPQLDANGAEIPIGPNENPWHLHLLEGHQGAVRALAAYGRICISGSYDCTVRIWDIVTGTLKHSLHGHEQKVYSIVYDRHRNQCASGSMDNTVKVWNVSTGECLHTLVGHTSLVGLLGNSPNYLVSAAADASLRIWDANTFEMKHTLASHNGAITCFQHDEDKVISGSEGTLKLWDIKTGQYIRDLVIGISSVWQVCFNGSLLVAASNRGGTTVFDVFDFGSNPHPSGMDDESLDRLTRPAWQRANPLEPQEYQVDDIDGVIMTSPTEFMTIPSPTTSEQYGYTHRMRNHRDRSSPTTAKLSGSRRSSRLAARNAPASQGTSSNRNGVYSIEPPPRSRRGTRMSYLSEYLSPTPAGPSSSQGIDLLGQSFIPTFDDNFGDPGRAVVGGEDEDMPLAGPSGWNGHGIGSGEGNLRRVKEEGDGDDVYVFEEMDQINQVENDIPMEGDVKRMMRWIGQGGRS